MKVCRDCQYVRPDYSPDAPDPWSYALCMHTEARFIDKVSGDARQTYCTVMRENGPCRDGKLYKAA